MTDVDIFAKLSRILETHHVTGDEDEDGDVMELLQRIERDGNKEDKMGASNTKTRNRMAATVATGVGDRPTPYDVWQAKQAGVFQFDSKEVPKLSEQQWDKLVNNLHSTHKLKDSSTREQNQGLAHELGGLSFKPQMNSVSMVLASTMKSLQHRLPEMISKRNQALEQKRSNRERDEMEECTFTPHREGARTSEKYLKRLGREKADPDDFMKYQDDKLRRNEQRKLIIEEIDSRELTFKPQLNAKSLKIQNKMMNERKIEVDPVSRQTVQTPKRRGDATVADDENLWHPEISTRARSYQSQHKGSVYDRLYDQAKNQMTEQHNAQVEYIQSKVALPSKPWEVARSTADGGASWAQNKTHLMKSGLPGEDLLVSPDTDPDYTPVFVVEYSDALGPMWRALRTAAPMEGFYEEPEAAEADV